MESFAQTNLQFLVHAPLVVSYGMGVDSTAVLVEFVRRGIRPDLILFADTGAESTRTYAYKAVIDDFLARNAFPPITVVRYLPKDFKNWPPYSSLEENCLTNATLPSLAFGFKSCSLKWKVGPQNKFVETWAPATECWAQGGRVRKVIGFDAGPADQRRRNHAGTVEDPRYDYWYPLIEWGWSRDRCVAEIEAAGLPVPPKSSCFFCPAMKKHEVDALEPEKLRRIVIMEARARGRLLGNMPQADLDALYRESIIPKWIKKAEAALAQGREAPLKPKPPVEGSGTKGLWRGKTMTDYIRERGLLASDEIDAIVAATPVEFLQRGQIESWAALIDDIVMAAAEESAGRGCVAI